MGNDMTANLIFVQIDFYFYFSGLMAFYFRASSSLPRIRWWEWNVRGVPHNTAVIQNNVNCKTWKFPCKISHSWNNNEKPFYVHTFIGQCWCWWWRLFSDNIMENLSVLWFFHFCFTLRYRLIKFFCVSVWLRCHMRTSCRRLVSMCCIQKVFPYRYRTHRAFKYSHSMEI